jgi:Predicted phosphohydrolases
MRIAQVTDLHLDDVLSRWHGIDSRSHVLAVFADIRARGIETVAVTGDCGAASSLPWLREALDERGLAALFALGNHDSAAAFEECGLIAGIGSPDRGFYHSRRLGGADCLFLDSSPGEIGDGQLEWLCERLCDADEPVYIFTHYPIFDCGSAVDLAFPLKRREEVQGALIRAGRRAKVFCGHYHFRHDQRIGLVEQYVAPAVIMQVRGEGQAIVTDSFDFGYRIVDLGLGTNEVVMFEGSGGSRERKD